MATYHGGDAGGDPPPHNWRPPTGCAGSGPKRTRGVGECKNLQKLYNKHGPLDIYFDAANTNTWQAVGEHAAKYKSLMGIAVSKVPYDFDSWADVPQFMKEDVIRVLRRFFKLDAYLDEQYSPEQVRLAVRASIDWDASYLYRLRKTRFKERWFYRRGGLDTVDQMMHVPPEGMELQAWQRLLRFYTREDQVARSAANRGNRRVQPYVGTHGRISVAVHRDEYARTHGGTYEPLIDTFEDVHKRKHDRSWEHPKAAEHHAKLKSTSQRLSQTPVPTPEPVLFQEALGKRTGHRRGIGRIVPGFGHFLYYGELPPPRPPTAEDWVNQIFQSPSPFSSFGSGGSNYVGLTLGDGGSGSGDGASNYVGLTLGAGGSGSDYGGAGGSGSGVGGSGPGFGYGDDYGGENDGDDEELEDYGDSDDGDDDGDDDE